MDFAGDIEALFQTHPKRWKTRFLQKRYPPDRDFLTAAERHKMFDTRDIELAKAKTLLPCAKQGWSPKTLSTSFRHQLMFDLLTTLEWINNSVGKHFLELGVILELYWHVKLDIESLRELGHTMHKSLLNHSHIFWAKFGAEFFKSFKKMGQKSYFNQCYNFLKFYFRTVSIRRQILSEMANTSIKAYYTNSSVYTEPLQKKSLLALSL